MTTRPMMTCGCVAQGVASATGAPVCVIHDCRDTAEAPSLEGRLARCSYNNGRANRWRNYGPIYGGGDKRGLCENGGKGCRCLVPSSLALPFFKHNPKRDLDEFFCGCAGWD